MNITYAELTTYIGIYVKTSVSGISMQIVIEALSAQPLSFLSQYISQAPFG